MAKDMHLYRVFTERGKKYYVLATDWNDAEIKVSGYIANSESLPVVTNDGSLRNDADDQDVITEILFLTKNLII